MKVIAKSKRFKAAFGLVFPLLYIPFPLYYYHHYPDELNIDFTGWIIIISFVILTFGYYYINGYGFIKSIISKNIISLDTNSRDLYIYDSKIIHSFSWTEISLTRKLGLEFFVIKNRLYVVEEVYANCSDVSFFKKSKLRNNSK